MRSGKVYETRASSRTGKQRVTQNCVIDPIGPCWKFELQNNNKRKLHAPVTIMIGQNLAHFACLGDEILAFHHNIMSF